MPGLWGSWSSLGWSSSLVQSGLCLDQGDTRGVLLCMESEGQQGGALPRVCKPSLEYISVTPGAPARAVLITRVMPCNKSDAT